MPDGTTIFFSPSLYLSVSTWPSLEADVCSTLPLVMVLVGCRSHAAVAVARPRMRLGEDVHLERLLAAVRQRQRGNARRRSPA